VNYNASAFGISVMRLGIDGIPDTRALDTNGDGVFNDLDGRPDYSQITFFNSADWVVYLSYAKQYSEHLFYGANLKLIYRDLEIFMPRESALTSRNIPGESKLFARRKRSGYHHDADRMERRNNELISPTLKVGGAYLFEIFGGRLGPSSIPISCSREGSFPLPRISDPSALTRTAVWEFDYKKTVAIRVGYDDTKNLTLGRAFIFASLISIMLREIQRR